MLIIVALTIEIFSGELDESLPDGSIPSMVLID